MSYTFRASNSANGAGDNNELIPIIKKDGNHFVSARRLYEFLEIKKRFSTWIKIYLNMFQEDVDWCTYRYTPPNGTQEFDDYLLTIDMAKQIAMMSRTQKGKEARGYFLAIEKAFKEHIKQGAQKLSMAEQLLLAAQITVEHEKKIAALDKKVEKLEEQKKLEDEWFGKLPPASVEVSDLDWQDKLNMKLRAYAKQNRVEFKSVWNNFYYKLGYHLKKNFFEMKKNGKKPLNWLRENHLGDEAYAVACKYFVTQDLTF